MQDLILPRTAESVPTPRSRDNSGIVTPKGSPKIKSSSRFKELMKKFKTMGKLDREDFNTGAEMGAFLDFVNQTNIDMKKRIYEENIHEISKFLARTQGRTTFIMMPSKDD